MASDVAALAITKYVESVGGKYGSVILSSKNMTKSFVLKSLGMRDLDDILLLQNRVISALCDTSVLQPSTEDEITESVEYDMCCGLYSDEGLCAFSITVPGRSCDRNLGADWLDTKESDRITSFVTFDTVQVLPEYRGFGIQKLFISLAQEYAKLLRAKMLVATVSPDNPHSRKNFDEMGFVVHPSKNPYEKYGSLRLLVGKSI